MEKVGEVGEGLKDAGKTVVGKLCLIIISLHAYCIANLMVVVCIYYTLSYT